MATPYIEVFNRFLDKVTDYFIFDLSDEETFEYCGRLMKSALAQISNMEHDLSDTDDEIEQFNETLNNTEIEYIAYQMVYEWVTPQVNNTALTRQMFGTKDDRYFAQANQISQLRQLREDSLTRRKKIKRDWNYEHSEYFNEN